MTGRRHALVIATQCPAQGMLSRLDEAARELRAVLTDDAIGACEPGLPDGRVVLDDGKLTGEQITTLVRTAIRYAAKHQATLILAFLGHGTLAGDDPTLYYMAPDSQPEDRSQAVNVPVLLTEAVDASGIDGVIALLDTCNAAAAKLSPTQVVTGVRGGRLRYDLLMASAVKQDARSLLLSRTLASLLRHGISGAPTKLSVRPGDFGATSMFGALRHHITTQDTLWDGYDNDDSAEAPLWLAHNLRAAPAASVNWGTLSGAGAALSESLVRAGLPVDLALLAGMEGLRELQRRLAGTGAAGNEARAVVDNLVVAHQTANFVNASMPQSLNSGAFQRALHLAGIVDDEPVPLSDELSLLAHIATRHPYADADGRRQVSRLVAALAAGQETPDWEAAEQWATSIRSRVAFNEARTEFESRTASQRLRLAIGLHETDLGAVWPRSVTAWLYDERGDVREKEEIDCVDDQAGVEEAVGRVVDWGIGVAERDGVELEHIDIALPTALLAGEWQPEGLEYHARLDEDFCVTVRWADRLRPSVAMSRSIKRSAKLLVDIERSQNLPPLDWLDTTDVRDPERLRARFVSGELKQAIGLARRPRDFPEVLAMALNYSPIVIWPQTLPELPQDRRGCLAQAWEKLPDAFAELYRRLRRGDEIEDTAHLRAVWDDNRWLQFCRRFQYTPLTDGEEHRT